MNDRVFVSSGLFSKYKNINKIIAENKHVKEIIVQPGSYKHQIVLNRSVEIIGQGPQESIRLNLPYETGIQMNAYFAKLKNLTISHSLGIKQHSAAIVALKGKLIIEDCVITSDYGVGLHVLNEGTEVILRRCKIYGTKHHGILAQNGCKVILEQCEIFQTENPGIFISKSQLYVRDSRIHSNKTNGVVIENGGKATFEHVHIYNNGYPNVWIGDVGSHVTFIGCHIYDGKDGGVKVVNGGYVIFRQCEIYNNYSYGVNTNGAIVHVEQTQLFGGQGYGIQMEVRSKLNMRHGKMYNNRIADIYADKGSIVDIAFSQFYHSGAGTVFVNALSGTIKDCKFYEHKEYSVKGIKESKVLIKNCTFSNSNIGIWGEEKAHIEVQQSQFQSHHDKAIFIEKHSSLQLSYTNFYNNVFGIDFAEHAKGTIEHCVFQFQHRSDVSSRSASTPHFKSCTFERSQGIGIIVYENARGEMELCRIGYHEKNGIKVTDGSELVLRECNIYGNKEYGIEIEEYSKVYMENVRVDNNEKDNIYRTQDSEIIDRRIEEVRSENINVRSHRVSTTKKNSDDEIIKEPELLEVLSELNRLVGMNNIKKHIEETILQIEVMKEMPLLEKAFRLR